MNFDQDLIARARRAAADSPDPGRAERHLLELLEGAEDASSFGPYLEEAARLFASSRFLASYVLKQPEALRDSLSSMDGPLTRKTFAERAGAELPPPDGLSEPEMISALRGFKRRHLLLITLRYLSRRADVLGSMEELSFLAEAMLEAALGYAFSLSRRRYGPPRGGERMVIIGLGKLGGLELNYSSDVDIMAVYGRAKGSTEGVLTPSGARVNRISVHEYYCKVVETLDRLLSANTPEGVAFRVDLRLRPQGQRGELALDLDGYREYYDSWARTWERMALLRARPVAGDAALGDDYMRMLGGFLWRRQADIGEIEDIRALKKKIDSLALKDDIKRGYGGIREAEFFVQTFQLLYGAEHATLRTYRILNAIQGLRRLGLVPEAELASLWESYLFLRRVEHYLQMREDLQTYALPADPGDMAVLARDMGFRSTEEFGSELFVRRMGIRDMYNSLLGTAEDAHAEAMSLLESPMRDEELSGYLSFKNVRDLKSALGSLRRFREEIAMPRPPGARALMRRVLPPLLARALEADSPERALAGLERLVSKLGAGEAYLAAFVEKKELQEGVVRAFSLSTRLTGLLLGSQYYLNQLIEDMPIRKSMRKMALDLDVALGRERDGEAAATVARFRGVEELRLGMYFLMGVLPVGELLRGLSHAADAAVGAAARVSLGRGGRGRIAEGFLVVGMGKYGGREITIGSDLDLMFVAERDEGVRQAEGIVSALSTYTGEGMAYQVDARLRPDGTKGPLTRSIEGMRDYYMKGARGWEVQALLRARPVFGDPVLAGRFLGMVREVVLTRAGEIRRADVRLMRERIMAELAREAEGIDIKLGPGGIEDIEFHCQWHQMRGAGKHPGLLVQGTYAALRRLAACGRIGRGRAVALSEAHVYYRKLESFLRLGDARVLARDGETTELAARFMGARDAGAFVVEVEAMRVRVREITSNSQ